MGDRITPEYSHEFSDEELDQLMYLWDEKASSVVHEYLYMKESWRQDKSKKKERDTTTSTIKKEAIDTGDRTEVDLTRNDDDSEEGGGIAYLDLDTETSAHVVEFYAPWYVRNQK